MNNETLAKALRRLLANFDTDKWPTITVALFKDGENRPVWWTGTVDDETREAIQFANKTLLDYDGAKRFQ